MPLLQGTAVNETVWKGKTEEGKMKPLSRRLWPGSDRLTSCSVFCTVWVLAVVLEVWDLLAVPKCLYVRKRSSSTNKIEG